MREREVMVKTWITEGPVKKVEEEVKKHLTNEK